MKLFFIAALSLFSVSTFAATGSCTSSTEGSSVCLQVDTVMPEVMESMKANCTGESTWSDAACKTGAVGSCINSFPVGTFAVSYYAIAGEDLATIQADCAANGGTWK
jgi:hypothetical protein